MPPPVIEHAGPDCAAAVIEVIKAVYADYGFLFDAESEVPDLLAFEKHYVPPQGDFFVVRDAGVIVGSIGASRHGDGDVEIHRLYLHPSQRGKGLGRVLCDRILAWARANGVPRLALWTDSRFTHAHALYERLGFTRAGQRVLEDLNQSTEYRYVRDLLP